jgi:hypothetical protein
MDSDEERDEGNMRPVAPGTDRKLQKKLAAITQEAQQSGEEARSLRNLLANALTLAARVAPGAPQGLED